MKWLENNPLGLGLLVASGVLLFTGLLLWLLWSRPVATDPDSLALVAPGLPNGPANRWEIGPARDYQVFNDRPLFNETRRPAVLDEETPEQETQVVKAEVAKTPDVRLTGVIITPSERLASLTPSGGGEALILREGAPLEGEYVGWSVNAISPREVRLRSARGENHSLELVVHDQPIKEPPRPTPVRPEPAGGEPDGDSTEEGQELSRAEEIRQRIAERREQLRQEAEQEKEDEQAQKASRVSAYQDAMRSMMNPGGSKDEQKDE